MSTITNKEGLRNAHRKLATNIKGWDMSFEDFAKAMEDDKKRSNFNRNIKKYFPKYSATDEELDKALGVIKSDLPSPTDELQQMSKPENNTAIINDLSQNLLEESQRIKKETEDPSIFETVGKGLASGIVRVGSGLMNQFSKVDPAMSASIAGGPNYSALSDPNRKTGKEQEDEEETNEEFVEEEQEDIKESSKTSEENVDKALEDLNSVVQELNQSDENKHDDINPSLSVSVIKSHVKKGVEKIFSQRYGCKCLKIIFCEFLYIHSGKM